MAEVAATYGAEGMLDEPDRYEFKEELLSYLVRNDHSVHRRRPCGLYRPCSSLVAADQVEEAAQGEEQEVGRERRTVARSRGLG